MIYKKFAPLLDRPEIKCRLVPGLLLTMVLYFQTRFMYFDIISYLDKDFPLYETVMNAQFGYVPNSWEEFVWRELGPYALVLAIGLTVGLGTAWIQRKRIEGEIEELGLELARRHQGIYSNRLITTWSKTFLPSGILWIVCMVMFVVLIGTSIAFIFLPFMAYWIFLLAIYGPWKKVYDLARRLIADDAMKLESDPDIQSS